MNVTVNTEVNIPIFFADSTGAGKTGLTVTATARLAGSATTAVTAVTERGSGNYDVAFTPTAVGQWVVVASTTIDGGAATWVDMVQAITAQQFDPAEFQEDTLSFDPEDYGVGTIGYEIHASFKRPIGSGGVS